MPGDCQNPTGKDVDYASMVKRVQGDDATKPEVVYEFSNGAKRKNTDSAPGGPYGNAAVPA